MLSADHYQHLHWETDSSGVPLHQGVEAWVFVLQVPGECLPPRLAMASVNLATGQAPVRNPRQVTACGDSAKSLPQDHQGHQKQSSDVQGMVILDVFRCYRHLGVGLDCKLPDIHLAVLPLNFSLSFLYLGKCLWNCFPNYSYAFPAAGRPLVALPAPAVLLTWLPQLSSVAPFS